MNLKGLVAVEMTPLLRYLPWRHEDQNLNSQNPHTARWVWRPSCHSSLLKVEIRDLQHKLASRTLSVSSGFNWESCLNEWGGKRLENIPSVNFEPSHTPACVCVCACIHIWLCICMCICVYMCVYTCVTVYVYMCVRPYAYMCAYVCLHACACTHVHWWGDSNVKVHDNLGKICSRHQM